MRRWQSKKTFFAWENSYRFCLRCDSGFHYYMILKSVPFMLNGFKCFPYTRSNVWNLWAQIIQSRKFITGYISGFNIRHLRSDLLKVDFRFVHTCSNLNALTVPVQVALVVGHLSWIYQQDIKFVSIRILRMVGHLAI